MVLKTHPVSVHRRSWSTEENETLAKGLKQQLQETLLNEVIERSRWMSSEDPLINHDPWTAEEENNLRLIIQEKGLQTGLTLLFH
ncbi:unnamed protein product [Brassica napus]|uniref:(rape) hypothetical protein n=1 Tax=Brassica napus TaxID=3708 RepID=A0A816LJP5_BRANA|nr:unnamed protein product [Brassica napus]